MPWTKHLAVSSLQHSLSLKLVPWPCSGFGYSCNRTVGAGLFELCSSFVSMVVHHSLHQVLEEADGELSQVAEPLIGRNTVGLWQQLFCLC